MPLKNSQGVTVKRFEQLDPHFHSTIRTFLATAVRRENLGQSWNIVAPSLKRGYTRQQWANAKALPVVPYPVADLDKVNYSLVYALENEVLVDVGVFAKPEADQRPVTFRIGLSPVGNGAKKQLVGGLLAAALVASRSEGLAAVATTRQQGATLSV